MKLFFDLKQVVKVPTCLNPPAILDTIITSMPQFYSDPVAKPAIESDINTGSPSDHLAVLWKPNREHQPPDRVYKSITTLHLGGIGLSRFGNFLINKDWNHIYSL